MTFFNPTEPIGLHLERLPDTAIATCAHYNQQSGYTTLTVWAPGINELRCTYSKEDTHDSFFENTCDHCDFYTDELSIDVDDVEMHSSTYGDVMLYGYANAYSPCPCYSDGIGSVSFPCPAGHDEPSGDNSHDVSLSSKYMTYQRVFTSTRTYTKAFQQSILTKNNRCYVSDPMQAINCYGNDDTICWGSLSTPKSLMTIESTYVASFGNEDLCSFGEIKSNVNDLEDLDIDDFSINTNIIPIESDATRPKALVVASASKHTNAYLLLGTSGCKVDGLVSYALVKFYPQVAIDSDTILDVWATEPLSTGTRLLFTNSDNTEVVGQVPSTFNLSICKSLPQQSSVLGALANKLSLV